MAPHGLRHLAGWNKGGAEAQVVEADAWLIEVPEGRAAAGEEGRTKNRSARRNDFCADLEKKVAPRSGRAALVRR